MARPAFITRNPAPYQGGPAWSGALAALFILLPFVAGCGDEDPVRVVDDQAPFPPDGVFSVTGDGVVHLYWNRSPEPDLAGYAVYRGSVPEGPYFHLDDVSADATSYDDTSVANGETVYYAVTAFDRAGNESDLSAELVFDTPRPAGTDLILFDFVGQNSGLSGYDFSSVSGAAQAWNAATTDIYFGASGGINELVATAGVDIQDYGWTASLDDVDWAPSAGWAPSGRAEAITGHAYVLRIVDGPGETHYAKVRVTAVTSASLSPDARKVTIDWAYQIDPGNPELSPGTRRDGRG